MAIDDLDPRYSVEDQQTPSATVQPGVSDADLYRQMTQMGVPQEALPTFGNYGGGAAPGYIGGPQQIQEPYIQPPPSAAPYAVPPVRPALPVSLPPAPAIGPKPTTGELSKARTPQGIEAVGEPQPLGGIFAPEKPGYWSDVGRAAEVSALGMGKDILGFTAWALDQQGAPAVADWLKSAQTSIGKSIDEIHGKISPEFQKALGSSLVGTTYMGGQVDPATGKVPGPSDVGVGNYIGATLASAIPPIAVFILGAATVGRVAAGGLALAGAGEGVAAGVGTTARLATLFGAGGATQAGGYFETIDKSVDDATVEQMRQSPRYNQLIQRGLDDKAARDQIKTDTKAGLPTWGQFLLGGVTNTAFSEILGRTNVGKALLPTREAGTPLTMGQRGTAALATGAEAGTAMGAQTGGGLAITQAADPTRTQPVDWRQVAAAAGQGFGAGAVVGGTLGGVFGPPRPYTAEGGSRGDGGASGPRENVTPAGMTPDVELAARWGASGTPEQILSQMRPMPASALPESPEQILGGMRPPRTQMPQTPEQILSGMRPQPEPASPEQILSSMRPQPAAPVAAPQTPEQILGGMRPAPVQPQPQAPEQILGGMRPAPVPQPQPPEQTLSAMRPAPIPVEPGRPLTPEETLGTMRRGVEPAPGPVGVSPEVTLRAMREPVPQPETPRGPRQTEEQILSGLREPVEAAPAPPLTDEQAQEILGGMRRRREPPPGEEPPGGGGGGGRGGGGRGGGGEGGLPPSPAPRPPRQTPEQILRGMRPLDTKTVTDYLISRGVDTAGMSAVDRERMATEMARTELAAMRERAVTPEPTAPTVGEVAKPSSEMKKGEVIAELKKLDPSVKIGRMNTDQLRQRLDELRAKQAEPTRETAVEKKPEPKLPPGIVALKERERATLRKREEVPPAKPDVEIEPVKTAEDLAPSQSPRTLMEGETQKPVPSRRTREESQEAARQRATQTESDQIDWKDIATTEPQLSKVPNIDKATNRAKVGKTFERAVSDGYMTPQAAEAAWTSRYGKSPRATIKSFRDYLSRRIEYLSNSDNERAVLEIKARNAAQVREINRERARFTPEYIQSLNDMRDMLDGKFRPDPNNTASKAFKSQRAFPDTIISPVSAAIRKNTHANSKVSSLFQRSGLRGAQATRYLDLIGNDPQMRVQMPWLSFLARTWKRMVPDELMIYHPEAMFERHNIERYGLDFDALMGIADYNETGNAASFIHPNDITKNFIVISPGAMRKGGVEVVMHEIAHAVTQRYINNLREGSREYQVLERIQAEFANHFKEWVDRIAGGEQAPSWLTKDNATRFQYALSDPHELYTHLTTNPAFRELASSIPIRQEFAHDMAQLGYPVTGQRSVWQAFTDFVRRVLGLPDQTKTLLDHVLRPLEDLTHEADQFNRMQSGPGRDLGITVDQAYRSWAPSRELGDLIARVRDDGGLFTPRDTSTGRLQSSAFSPRDLANPVSLAREARDLSGPYRRGAWSMIRRGLLQAIPKDLRVSRYGKLFTGADGRNLLAAERRVKEMMENAGENFRNKYFQPAKNLIDELRGKDDLQSLLVEATLNKTHLGAADPQTANAHLTPEERARWLDATAENGKRVPSLQEQFDNLPVGDQALYHKTNKLFSEMYKEEREAKLNGTIRSVFGDRITDAQRTKLYDQLRTKTGLDRLLKNLDDNPVQQEFGTEWLTNRKLVRELAKFHDLGFVQGDYFPLRRFGDYVVTYGDRESRNFGVEMMESRKDAEIRQRELYNDKLNPSTVRVKSTEHMRSMINLDSPFLTKLNQEIAKRVPADQVDGVRDLIASQVLQHMTRSAQSRGAISMRREYIRGASKDVTRVIASDVHNAAFRIGYALHGPELAAIRGEMQRHVALLERRTDPITNEELPLDKANHMAGMARDVMREYELERPQSDNTDASGVQRAIGRGTHAAYIHALLSFSQPVVNSLEAHIVGTALIGGRHGFGAAAMALGRATSQLLPKALAKTWDGTTRSLRSLRNQQQEMQRKDWQVADVFAQRLIDNGAPNAAYVPRLTEALKQTNMLNYSLGRDLEYLANPTGISETKIGRAWDKLEDASAAMGHFVEEANKMAVAKAAFDLELKKLGGGEAKVDQAIDYAIEQLRRTIPNWRNKARLATAHGSLRALGPAVMQFRNYGLQIYSLIPLLFHEARLGNKDSRNSLLMMMGSIALTSGAFGWLDDLTRLGGGIYDLMTGAKHPHNYIADLERAASDMLGPRVAEILGKGVLFPAGVDIHHRIGVFNPLNFPDLSTYQQGDVYSAVGKLATGATGSTIGDLIGAASTMIKGDIIGGIKESVPRPVRDLIQAGQFTTEGIPDSRGRLISKPISGTDALIKSLGFQPSSVTRIREGRAAQQEVINELTDERSAAIDRYIEATQGRLGMGDAWKLVNEFNRTHPQNPIKGSELQTQLRLAQQQLLRPDLYGMRVPRRLQSVVQEATRHIPQ